MGNIVDSDFTFTFIIEDEDGEAQDVSAWTFETQWYSQQRQKVHTLTDGVEFAGDGTDGSCQLVLTAAQTRDLGAGVARVVIWRTDGGRRLVIGEGTAAFEALDRNA